MKIEDARYAVVRSAFHGGGLISLHKSFFQALRSLRKSKFSDCQCGCAGIVDLRAKESYFDESEYINIYSKYDCARSIENAHPSSLQYQF